MNDPAVAIVEARNEQVSVGLGQCIAKLIAAKIFNDREGNLVSLIYQAVTTGNDWNFLEYAGSLFYIYCLEYYIENIKKSWEF